MECNRFYRRLSLGIAGIYCAASLGAAVWSILDGSVYQTALSFAAFLFLPLPGLLHRLLRLKPAYAVHTLLYAFCLLAYVGGMALRGYQLLPGYDKLVHGLSGVVFGLIGILLFYLLKPVKQIEPGDYGLVSWFSLCFAASVAAVWELYEYLIGLLMHTDPQRVLDTGAADTMLDIAVCLAGALLLELSIRRYYKRGRRTPLMGMFESFYEINLKNGE